MVLEALSTRLSLLADTSGAVSVMRGYVAPTIRTLAALASIACVLFLVNGGYQYITSRGNPEALENAKRVIRNALLGLVIVLAAATLTTILTGAYGDPSGTSNATLPSLQAIEPENPGNGLVDVLIKAVTGFLNNIIQAVGAPFLSALDYFTKETPLMAKNSSVFNLWLAMVGIILANVGTVISFRTGNPQDERLLLPLFSPYIEQSEISNLPAFNFYAKLSAIQPQEPLSGQTLLLEDDGSEKVALEAVKLSRKLFAKKQEQPPEKPEPEPNKKRLAKKEEVKPSLASEPLIDEL